VALKPTQWPTGFLQCFDTVGWVIWPVKIVPKMTYKVSSGTLNLSAHAVYCSRSSECLSVTQAGCAKMAEQIDILFGVVIPRDLRNIVLDGVLIPRGERRGFDAAFAKLLWLLVYNCCAVVC